MKTNNDHSTPETSDSYTTPEIVKMGLVAEITAGQGGDSKDSTDMCIPVPPFKP